MKKNLTNISTVSYTPLTLFIFLISAPSFLLAMDPPMPPPVHRVYPIDFQPMGFANDTRDDDGTVVPHPISAQNSNTETFEGMDVKDLQTILAANKPQEMNLIINHLKDRELLLCPNYRSEFFIGEHGIGKTILAKALAHKLINESSWSYEYISSSAFAGPYRNQTAVNLRGYLKRIVARNKPILLIIDQLNKILEYTESADDDTAATSSVFCNFLDEQEYNENIFTIGIMDRAIRLSENLKSRMLLGCTSLEKPTTPELKRIIFMSKCINERTQFHPEVTNEWLEAFLTNAPTITARNLRGLAIQVQELINQERLPDTIILITKQHLETALASYIAARKDIEHIDPYEAHRDKVERLHTERMRQMVINTVNNQATQNQQCIIL